MHLRRFLAKVDAARGRPRVQPLGFFFLATVAGCCALLAAGAGAAAAQTRPALDSLALDPARHDPARGCSRGPQRGGLALEAWLRANVIGDSWGVFNCRYVVGTRRWSLHAEGRAVDWRLDAAIPAERAAADRLIARLLAADRHGRPAALARRMGLQEIIFNCRIWLAGDGAGLTRYGLCRPRRDRKGRLIKLDRSDAHRDHIHIGLNWPGARKQTSFWRR